MIYHIATSEDWNLHLTNTTYMPQAFSREGFIHCSTKGQVQGVLQRYYAGVSNLVLLHIDEAKLSAALKYEEASNHEFFPHVFGPINKEAIIKTEVLSTMNH
jgi:uncharacterized protein (DUF952 family)